MQTYYSPQSKPSGKPQQVPKLITYTIVQAVNPKLDRTAKIACNFWNYFVVPGSAIVIRLGTFYSPGNVIARAYEPYTNGTTIYGRIEFNTKYLSQFDDYQVAGTIIHEIGHTLGFGWDKWMTLFDRRSGEFYEEYIQRIPELQYMLVETDYGPGTEYSHWDEERFDEELMTGIKDTYEYVLPVTIKVMSLLGNTVINNLSVRTDLRELLRQVEGIRFTKTAEITMLDLDYFEETKVSEEIYTKAFQSPTNQVLGIVEQGRFKSLLSTSPGMNVNMRLTTIAMLEARSPETAELDISEYEGKAIMVSGHHGGDWIYSAEVIDVGSPILTAMVQQVFTKNLLNS